MKPQCSPFTVPSWLKWSFIIIGALFILSGALAVWMYLSINQDLHAGEEAAQELALNRTELAKVENVSSYHGKKKVHIVKGKTQEGTEGLIFIDLSERKILNKQMDLDIVAEQQLKQSWRADCQNCVFKNIQLGYEEEQPVYELTYVDSQNRYVFDYFNLNGERFELRFAFKQN
ncbi:cell wall elongation regulator TseB-like domain-containing protein [Halobacillus sp. K22]|uniref:cell wall elongation regulator TseB-like domain-containing protein n=1 Tax=Halobacillus sp. K22 TaxID=3457431 RepID=UPI003FCCDCA6